MILIKLVEVTVRAPAPLVAKGLPPPSLHNQGIGSRLAASSVPACIPARRISSSRVCGNYRVRCGHSVLLAVVNAMLSSQGA